MELLSVRIEKPEDLNLILGQALCCAENPSGCRPGGIVLTEQAPKRTLLLMVLAPAVGGGSPRDARRT